MLWTEQERAIFGFELPDGSKRFIDPLKVRRGLARATAGKIDQLLQKQHSASQMEQLEADEALVPAISLTFGLPTINKETGVGYTEQFLLDLLESFVTWIADQKKTVEKSPTLPLPSD